MTQHSGWTNGNMKVFKNKIHDILVKKHPGSYNCLLQLAVIDKFLVDLKFNFIHMQNIRNSLSDNRNAIKTIYKDFQYSQNKMESKRNKM